MVNNTERELTKVIKYLNGICKIQFSHEKILESIEATNFTNLQKLENRDSFYENPKMTEDQKFFRNGTTNQWKKTLSKDLINKIQKEFGQTMKENGYEF